MNSTEFAIWLTNHRAVFPGLSSWLGKLDNAADVLAKWRHFLLGVDFALAKNATDKLAMTETKVVFDRHPYWVLDFCRREGKSQESVKTFSRFGQKTNKCNICHDTGQVSVYVYGRHLPRYIEMYGPEATTRKTCAVHCSCEIGRKRGCPILNSDMIIEERLIHLKQEVLDKRVRQIDSAIQGVLIDHDKVPRPQFPPSARILDKFAFWRD